MNKKSVATLLIGIFAIGLFSLQGCSRQKLETKATPVGLPVEVAKAQTREMNREVLLTGTVKPRQESVVAANQSDRILAVRVREGDRVQAGQVLIQIDPTSANARLQQAVAGFNSARSQAASAEAAYESVRITAPSQVKQAQANLTAARKQLAIVRQGARSQERAVARNAMEAARSSLQKATLDLQRAEKLYQQGAAAKEQVDSMRNQYDVTKSQYESAREQYELLQAGARTEEIEAAAAAVEQTEAAYSAATAGLKQVEISRLAAESAQSGLVQAQGAVTDARNNLTNTVLRAPIAGVIYEKNVEVGDVPSSGTPLMKIAALERVYFEATVPEKDFALLSTGQSVDVVVDALRGSQFNGILERLVPVATGQSRDFLARIAVNNPGLKLRPGMFARGSVLVEHHPMATVVPNEAILEREGQQVIFIVQNDKAQTRTVTIGLQNASYTEILSGITPGDEVITSGQQGLKSGEPVNVTARMKDEG